MNKIPKSFRYSDILGGRTEGIMRRDPSPVIQVGNLYYVWYSRSTVTCHGYTATIWYATSPDGHVWTEQKQALGRGAVGAFDEHAVFTPSLFIFDGVYYLSYTAVPEPFYQGLPGQPCVTRTAIGLARAASPEGPWTRVSTDPILRPSDDPAEFDSLRTDDSCFVIRGGKIWLYYKGRQQGFTWKETKMGVAVAECPEGPYVKVRQNPVVNGGHEVCVWPTEGGIASMHCNVGPAGNSLQFSRDGVTFGKVADLIPPSAPGPFRADHYGNNSEMTLTWGVCMQGDANWPWLRRFEAVYE